MKRHTYLLWLLLLWSTISSSSAFGQRRISALEIPPAVVKVDGRLDEAAWSRADVSRGMTERTPNPGTDAAIDFEFRVLFDTEALYFGLRSSLLPSETPRSVEMRRDTYNIFSDDTFTIKLDVHKDQVTTIGFAFNAVGAQTDYMAMTTGGGFRREFDAVWVTESVIEDGVWTVEARIPFAALGVPRMDNERIIGLNITRDHNARVATYDWSALPPELGPIAATHYGELRGVRYTGTTGRAVRFIPYLLASTQDGSGIQVGSLEMKSGFDLRLSLTKHLWGEATVFTDFAEVDLDDALINLSRFPLFLPEKRPFFLSGLDVFAFGDARAYQLFYSRRIGLDDEGNPVPIWAGAKVHGRVGRLSIGGLSVMTDKTADRVQTQYSVVRVRNDFSGQGTLGAILAHRFALVESATAAPHTSLGVDWTYRFLDNRLRLSAFSALTMNERRLAPGADTKDCALEDVDLGEPGVGASTMGATTRVRAQYRGVNLTSYSQVRQVDCHFQPEMGFVSRTDIRSLEQENGYTWRGLLGPLTRFFVGHESGLTLDNQANRYLGMSTLAKMSAVFLNQIETELGVGYAEDVVDTAFELPNGRTVEPSTYTGEQLQLELSASRVRNPYGGIAYAYNGGFYGGESHSARATLGAVMGAHFRVAARARNTWLVFPNRHIDQTTTFNGDMSIAVSPKLFLDMNVQANTVAETGNVLSRLRWRYYPGSDLYFVYQERFDVNYEAGLTRLGSVASRERIVTLKLTYWHDGVL